MKELAKMLGLKLYEEFMLDDGGLVYRFTENKLERKDGDEWNYSRLELNAFFQSKIVKLPFKPKYNDVYWTVECNSIYCGVWEDKIIDIALYNQGNCFRTEEEAEKSAEKIRKCIDIYKNT